ncbi:phage major capsid protein [Clostridium massiliodielmoense]|uniref:phage major capsid protein n=1 Tax=Clostridium massiliodielmoense TaxID=1776385 RepID=UPI00135639B1|nr:phage major capsid protein [Clostridium massiliodielmoense]
MLKSVELKQELEAVKEEANKILSNKSDDIDQVKALNEKIESLKNDIKVAEQQELEEKNYMENKIGNGGVIEMGGKNLNMNSNFKILNSSNITKVYENKDNLDLGKYIRGALTGQWDNAIDEMNQFKALSTGTGSVLIPQSLSAEVLKAVMNKSLIYQSGVPVVDMPNGNLTIAKVKNNPAYEFKKELEKATPQDATFEGVNLKGRMCYGLMKVSLETLHSAANLSQVLLQAMSDSIADSIDKSMVYGTGTTDIKGLFNYDSINTVEATGLDYKTFVNAVGKIKKATGEPTVMGINADVDTALNLLTDTTGQPLQAPKVIEGLNKIVSNQLKNDDSEGSDGIVYDPSALIIGQQVQFVFETSRELGFEDGSVWLRIYSLVDMVPVRPEHITHIKGLK